MLSAPLTPNASVSSYTAPRRTVAHSQLDRSHPTAHVLKLPKALSFLPTKGIDASLTASTINNMVLAVADTGATDHICPERSTFISYHPVPRNTMNVRMGDKSLAPVLGKGTIIILLNGKLVLVCNMLHVPTLCTPLCNVHKHLTQCGCGFIGNNSLWGLSLYFSTFVLAVDTTKNCHLSYKPIGRQAALNDLDYIQPRCALKVLPPPPAPADWEVIQYACH